jgi:hypothetical protein
LFALSIASNDRFSSFSDLFIDSMIERAEQIWRPLNWPVAVAGSREHTHLGGEFVQLEQHRLVARLAFFGVRQQLLAQA